MIIWLSIDTFHYCDDKRGRISSFECSIYCAVVLIGQNAILPIRLSLRTGF